ncbi:hypothetical protein EON64_20555 [archaeon]|nr:MAG: hypothetical protein EON64_20555 [archaeon]
MSQRDIDLLFTAFWDIDADGSGQVRPGELFHYFEVEGQAFELALFSLFDEGISACPWFHHIIHHVPFTNTIHLCI